MTPSARRQSPNRWARERCAAEAHVCDVSREADLRETFADSDDVRDELMR